MSEHTLFQINNTIHTLFIDIDECTKGPQNCDRNADCNDIDGSYTCACMIGWTGDGFTCTGMFIRLLIHEGIGFYHFYSIETNDNRRDNGYPLAIILEYINCVIQQPVQKIVLKKILQKEFGLRRFL